MSRALSAPLPTEFCCLLDGPDSNSSLHPIGPGLSNLLDFTLGFAFAEGEARLERLQDRFASGLKSVD